MTAAGAVLVVDDDVLVRDVVGRYLSRAGYQVTVAGDGEHALRAAQACPPDLVVLDLMLPGSVWAGGVPAVAGGRSGAGRHAHRPG